MSNAVEILSSELYINENKINDINIEIEKLDKKIEELTVNLDSTEYLISIISGIISGMIDSFYVGEFKITKEATNEAYKQVNKFIANFAKKNDCYSDRLKRIISSLEKKFSVPNDNVWKNIDKALINPKNHHLDDLAHHLSPMGLICFIIVYYFDIAIFVNREGTTFIQHIDSKDAKERLEKLVTAIIIAVTITSLVFLIEYYDQDNRVPKGIRNSLRNYRNKVILNELKNVTHLWFGHLVSDMGGSKNTAGYGMGIPGVFMSFLHELTLLPFFRNKKFTNKINDLYVKDKLDFRHEIPIYKEFGKQAIPIIINDVVVRLLFFMKELTIFFKEEGDISQCIPYKNKKVNRMLLIADVTFTSFDIADAGIRAILETGLTPAAMVKFSKRVNYVGGGKVIYSIVRETLNEHDLLQLIKERNQLQQQEAQLYIKQLNNAIQILENKIEEIIIQDVSQFLLSFNYIDDGIQKNDSNKVIKGCKILHQTLHKELQFNNQDEFDELMDSDFPLNF